MHTRCEEIKVCKWFLPGVKISEAFPAQDTGYRRKRPHRRETTQAMVAEGDGMNETSPRTLRASCGVTKTC